MKKNLTRLLPLLLSLSLALSACGGAQEAPYDPAATAEALLASDAFSQALDTLDQETAALLYGLEEDAIQDCVVYASLSAGAEEIAVLRLSGEAEAEAALEALEQRVADQTEALRDYQPEEVSKLEHAIVERRGASALLVVAADHGLAQAALDALEG